MIDIIGHFDGKNSIVFMPEQAEELGSEFKKNQPVRTKTTRQGEAIGKVLEQSNLLHACFKLVSENKKDDPRFSTEKVTKLSCKMGIDFRDTRYAFVRPDGGIQFVYRSFSFKELKGRERDEVMQKAFEWLAAALGTTVDAMVEMAQDKMLRRY